MNEKELKKRMEKARGLKVMRQGEGQYVVESSNGEKFYSVYKDGDKATCDCQDFKRHCGDNDWRCKHILAVERHLEDCAEKPSPSHCPRQCQGEDANPNPKISPVGSIASNGVNRKLLEAPFDESLVKQRKGAFGDVLDYVEGHAVIRRLNDAFDAQWSFEIIDHKVMEEEVIVLGKLTADGISKMQFGRSKITRSRDDNSVISLGDDLKAAATDALKKASTHFGVGLHLYEEKNSLVNNHSVKTSGTSEGHKEWAQEAPKKVPSDNGKSAERLTNRQLTAIYSIAQDKGISSKEMEQRILKVFGKKPEYLSKNEASDVIKQLSELEKEEPAGVKEKEESYGQ